MPDYSFTHLSTRSFEKLVQDIAIAVIGLQVLVFGDGRDGGREATFEGPTSYPDTSDPWVGYGVIQAKFKQRDSEFGADEWALKELKKELKNLKIPLFVACQNTMFSRLMWF